MKLDHVCRVVKGARAPVVRVTCKLDCAPLPTLRFTSSGTRCNFSRVWRQNCAEKTGPSLSDQHCFSGSSQPASERRLYQLE